MRDRGPDTDGPEADVPNADLDTSAQLSMIRRLARTPRVFALSGAMLLAGLTFGVREFGRLALIADYFNSEWGVSVVAAVIAVSSALASVVSGRLVDRIDPRRFLYFAIGLTAVSSLATVALLLTGAFSIPWLLILSAIDAAGMGLSLTSMLKIQAAIVIPSAVGGAEMLNVLRIGVGGVVGAGIADVLGSVVRGMVFTTVTMALALALVWRVLRPVRARLDRGSRDSASLRRYLRSAPDMRRLIAIDLALTFVIPTQLVNVVLIGKALQPLIPICIMAGMVGVLVGRVALLSFGFRGQPTTIVRVGMGGLIACQIATAILLTNDVIFVHVWLVVLLIAVSTVLLTYSQGLLAALVQQNLDESVRGRLSGALIAGRALLVSVAAIGAAAISASLGPQVLLVVLASGLAIVILSTRAFAGLAVRQR